MTVAPADLVPLGAVRGAYGVRGWVRIAPYAAEPTVLLACRRWWLLRDSHGEPLTVNAVRRHRTLLLAKWEGYDQREAVESLRGREVAVARAEFPPASAGEYYWVDLIGARVVNRAGVALGVVVGLRSNGAQDVLEIKGQEATMLVPMVDCYIDEIDTASRLIRVDWELHW
ncbi:MAG: ribosome maturation factor RimM [Sutterellaceae bacterium]|nr:ribosome maturation factor RimM [Burkholderiaceae bacterium]MCX7901014.1 ribosome maturation factor RimM [Burkholderiaceae bacterium]MDW8430360.1 ribosome maturation factor RimM [Sutterellaceae bacterium]